jgi:hypothetical protein
VTLIEQRTALVNQLQQALYEYYPAALEAFDDWCAPSAWAFVERFPTPQALVQAGKRKWQNFLHAHKLFHPEWNKKRLEIFARADQFCGTPASIAAKSTLALALARLLQTLEAQLTRYRALITDASNNIPITRFCVTARRSRSWHATVGRTGRAQAAGRRAASLAGLAGMASVSYQSGQVVVICATSATGFAAHHHSGDLSRHCAIGRASTTEAHRKKGQSHACALRCLGMRWLKSSAMIRNQTPYDAAIHTRNQLQHGSWILQLQPVQIVKGKAES